MINDASIVKIERQPTEILPTGGLGVPAGGSQGQVLAKSTNSNYDTAWVDPSIGVPAGGSIGQFLVKKTNTNYDTIWQDLPSIQSTEYLLQTVYNGSGSTINRGSIVSFVGGDGSYPIVEKAVSSSIHDSDVIGVALDNILNGEYGSIVVNGILDGFNTNDFNVGDKLYLSSVIDGAITNIVPTAPNHAIFIGFCIKKDAVDGAIYINLNTGTHLDLLHDVSINLPSSGDVLFFNENNTWVNKKIDVYNVSGAVGSGDFKNIVFQTGNQNISGVKTFFHRPILSGSQIQSNQSGLAMLGEVVTINGSQTITGPKTFSANVAFSNSAIDYSSSEINFYTTDFNLDTYSSSGLASNLRGFFVDIDTNQIVNGRKTFKSGIKLISQNSYALDVSGSALFSERPTVNGTGVLLTGDIDTSNFYPNNNPSGFITGVDLSNYAENSDIFNSAVEWTINHTLADGTRYLAGDLVYFNGKVYKANYDNESLPVTNTLYWTDLGPGYRLNIDGRDIPNIPQVDISNLYPNNNPSGFITGIENVVYTTGDQAISGKKTFLEGLEAGTGNISTLYVKSGAVGINNESPQGALDVSGSALFSERPTVNGTGVLLQGEVQNNTIISGVVYSAQVNVKNYNGSTIYKGQPVYIAGAEGGNILVKLASNVSEQSSSKTLGLVVQDSLDNNAFGTVITDGLLENFDVSVASAGDPIWLGPTGSLLYGLANKPHAPNHMVYLGVVTRAQNNGEVFVKVQNGYELDELHDLNTTTSQSGQFLFKNNNLWSGKFLEISDISGLQTSLNDKQSSGNYYLSSNPSGFITSNSTSIAGAASISNIIQIAQTGYDAIVPQANTLYIII
jgi:predicted RecA/RadA family phage recombinase